MAKKKLDLSGEGLKKLAIEHCEKLVFGVCALLLLLLAYWGYSKPVFDDSKDNPNNLISSAQQSRTRINNSTWENQSNEQLSFAKYRIADEEVPQKVEKLNLVKLDPMNYPTFPPGEISLSIKPKRINPEVLAATDVQAKFAYQMIALKPGTGGSSRISESMFAPKPKKEKKSRRKKKNKKKDGMRSGMSGMSGSGSMEDQGSSPGAGGMGGAPSSGGAGTGGTGGSNPSKDLKPDGPIHDPPATMLEEVEGVPLDGMIPSEGDEYPSVMWRQVVCVTALVPFKKQVEAYEKALKGTRRYDQATDIPKYIGLVISRRINGGDWVDVTDEIKTFSKKAQTVYYPRLVVDDEFDPFLNAQVPAFLMKDFDQFILHPKSKTRDFLELDEEETSTKSKSSSSSSFDELDSSGDKEEEGDAEEEIVSLLLNSDNAAENKQVRFFDLLANSAIKPGDKFEYKVSVILSNPNLPLAFITGKETSSSGGMSSGRGMSSGMSSGRGGSAENRAGDLMGPAGGSGGSGGASPPGMSGGGGGSTPDGGGMNSGRSGMSGGGRMGGSSRAAVSTSSELTLEMLGNPNISDTDLDGTIRPEILKFKDMDPPELTDKGLAQKYGLISPESSVSNAVQFVVPSEEFVGGGAPPLNLRRADNVEFYDAEPKGEVVYMKQDKNLQMPVPGKAMVSAGSPLVFDAMAEVFNPLDWSIRWIGPPGVDDEGEPDPKKRGNYRFRSGAIVLDVMQSETLDNISDLKQEFLTPAEVLVFDGKGGFSLRNELDDAMAFRHATFADDVEVEEDEGISGFGDKNKGGSGGAGGTGDLPSFGDN